MCKVIKSYCLKDYNDKRLLQSQFELEKKIRYKHFFCNSQHWVNERIIAQTCRLKQVNY
jgi:hypothetical protein